MPVGTSGRKGVWTETEWEEGPEGSITFEGVWFPLEESQNGTDSWGVMVSRPISHEEMVHVAERPEPTWDKVEDFSDALFFMHARDFLAFRQNLMDKLSRAFGPHAPENGEHEEH